jgi:hypothetical protein
MAIGSDQEGCIPNVHPRRSTALGARRLFDIPRNACESDLLLSIGVVGTGLIGLGRLGGR